MTNQIDPRYDISTTTLAKSDQLNADDLLGGPITVQVLDAYVAGGEQPVHIHLNGWDKRPYKPSKTMRKVIEHAWGKDMTLYPGRWLTLYRDPNVTYGGQTVGGIKISHMSHIEQPIKLALTERRGKKTPHEVLPLTPPTTNMPSLAEQAGLATSVDQLRALWRDDMTDADKNIITTRAEQLKSGVM